MSIRITEGAQNVFVDLGLPDADELLVKAKLAFQISRMIEECHLTQNEAASRMGISQPKLSNVLRGKFEGISEHKMMQCIAALGHDIMITISPSNNEQGRIDVDCDQCLAKPRIIFDGARLPKRARRIPRDIFSPARVGRFESRMAHKQTLRRSSSAQREIGRARRMGL